MTIYLLLAGQSTRFWPLCEKPLFPICGKTLLQHQVERLQEGGCNDIVLVGGAHNIEEVKTIYPDLQMIEQENEGLGMHGAAMSIVKAHGNEPLMIVSGNDVIEPRAYADLLASKGDGAILACKVSRYFPGGYLKVDGDRIVSVVEKPEEGSEPSDLVNIVAHVHRNPDALRTALEEVDLGSKEAPRDDGYEQALQKLFDTSDYRAVIYEGAWQAVKYPWHIIMLCDVLLSEISVQKIHESASVHESAIIEGNVVIEEGVRVMPHAVIIGPAYIGARSIVANNALVRGSSIGSDCVVGYCTEVKSSVLQSNVWTHMNYVGESVIGDNVSLGAGTVTGNLRLDEQEIQSQVKGEKINTQLVKFGTIIGSDSRLGIHVSINPGIKVGKSSFISSKTLILEDIPDGSYVTMKNGELDVRENRTTPLKPESREKFRKKIGNGKH